MRVATVGADEARRRCSALAPGVTPDACLLLLGDTTPALAASTRFLVCEGSGGLGLAARFDGFGFPVVTAAGADSDVVGTLVRHACGGDSGSVVCLHGSVPVPAWLNATYTSRDGWMVRPTARVDVTEQVVSLSDADELGDLYHRIGSAYWVPDMLGFGHHWGIRAHDRQLVAAAGVNFVLPDHSYGQIGGVATHPDFRGRGFAASCVGRVIGSLFEAGVPACGLFADGETEPLVRLYRRLGFSLRGHFRFFNPA